MTKKKLSKAEKLEKKIWDSLSVEQQVKKAIKILYLYPKWKRKSS